MDRDGYGAREGQTPVDRLLEDCRTLSPAGIERIARSWEVLAGGVHHPAYVAAERALLGTALALVAGPGLEREHREALLRPTAEALPRLLAGNLPVQPCSPAPR